MAFRARGKQIINSIASISTAKLPLYKKLWENPAPTSAFAAQTITLLSDDYDFTLTIARRLAAYQQDICTITPKGDTVVLNVGVAGGSGASCAWRRFDYVNDTSFSVIDCKTATGTAAATTDNTLLVPLAIYGFKKEVDIASVVASISTEASKCYLSDGVTSVGDAIYQNAIYSESEHVVGKWIDGSTVYEKTISIGALPNNTAKSTPHGISNLGYLISASGVAQRNSPYRAHPIPYVNASSVTDQIQVVVLETYVTVYTSMDYSGFANTYITLRYTKSS